METTLFTKLVYKYRYWRHSKNEIWLITLYAQNEASTISPQVLQRIAEEIKHG